MGGMSTSQAGLADPIGGGVGYSRGVGLQEATVHLTNADPQNVTDDFLSILSNLQTGDSLFIDGDVVIDLTGEEMIAIGGDVENITIASDRTAASRAEAPAMNAVSNPPTIAAMSDTGHSTTTMNQVVISLVCGSTRRSFSTADPAASRVVVTRIAIRMYPETTPTIARTIP